MLRDLGSANGTLVNGAPVQVTVLKDGDVLALAGVEPLKVAIEMGDVLSASGARSAFTLPHQAPAAFSRDWQTRYEWDSAEMAVIEAVRRGEPPPEVRTKLQRPPDAPPPAPRPPADARPVELKPAPAPAPAPPLPAPAAAPAPVPPPPPAPAAAPSPAIRSVHLRTDKTEITATEPGSYLIGRAPDVPLRLDDNTVSRRHATLILGADRRTVEIRDEGAANGTFVNGAKVPAGATQALADGDELRLGHLPLRVRIK